ncbi:MAG TPA: hypothetical protein VG710_11940 [Opitutus sp.]|nr:hypothetical protein [Opitutus sp.]
MFRRTLVFAAAVFALGNASRADPLSKKTDIDFFREVPSRNLHGFAARSDGRLVAGPTFTDLNGTSPADLLWCLAPSGDPAKWFVGTGPDGRIFEITIDPAKSSFTSREIVKLDEPHIFSLVHLANGDLLAGTSPHGALSLIRQGKQIARVALPVDSIFDILLLPNSQSAPQALIATGNPGRIYRVDLAKFAAAAVAADKLTDPKALAEHGLTLFGEIRDRNVRRLARLTDGRIIAGSAPKGNIYAFPAPPAGLGSRPSTLNPQPASAPVILQENRDAEVTDLLPQPDGGFYAALTYSGGSGENRITPPKNPVKDTDDNAITFLPFSSDHFSGRSSLLWFPAGAFPETVAARGGTAFYRLALHDGLVLIAGGEQGEMLGYDPDERLSLTFAGSASSQLNGLVSVPGHANRFLVLRNNAPGFAILDFAAAAPREAETRHIDLGDPSQLGAIRFNRLRDVSTDTLSVELSTSNGSDEVEGWSAWTSLKTADDAWQAGPARGRYVKLRLELPANSPATVQIDKAAVYALPQNHRPQLQDFHLLSPNFGLIPAPDIPTHTVVSLGQLLQQTGKDDDKRKNSFLSSQLVPSPGAQVVFWTVVDPDGDNLVCTFSLRRDGDTAWTDVAHQTSDPYAQFDISHLPEGTYFTRLVVSETDPRPAADRLTTTFETDDLIVDHTPPNILDASAKRTGDKLVISVHGRDALSLLEGIEANFNNTDHEQTEQPADGIRDGREETFTIEVPFARVAGATSVEVTLYDAAGNTAARRLTW